ncbi:uncharacterized protein LODBEIA_P49530 [Lodderomyces beijingensis]|uniref:Uncharacterized protein n=1 Tax=Lodderomyces beijingensis TaxID=1775926 RepID=A0ABP0ZS41_9ASCO
MGSKAKFETISFEERVLSDTVDSSDTAKDNKVSVRKRRSSKHSRENSSTKPPLQTHFSPIVEELNFESGGGGSSKNKHSVFTRILFRFRSKKSGEKVGKSKPIPNKCQTVHGVGNNNHHHHHQNNNNNNVTSVSWVRKFSKNRTVSVFHPFSNFHFDSSLDESNDVPSPRLLDLASPPSIKPMRTIESVQESVHMVGESTDTNTRETSFLPIDECDENVKGNYQSSLKALYENSFFKYGARQPIEYDNSQITDETLDPTKLSGIS